jgi:methylated-DNA-[protein]-cysteine S-methyltransferase
LSQLLDCCRVDLPRFGLTTVVCSANGIVRLEFGETSPDPLASPDSYSQHACQQLLEYFNRERTGFDIPFDLLSLPAFQQEVLRLTCTIPYGETRTYGDLAQIVGTGSDARAVGVALATNPIPIFIPCHRVISSDGKLKGYSGPGGLETKAWLLQLEGARLIA